MALLIDQLQWEQPLVPEFTDPAWEAEIAALLGGYVPGSLKRVASSDWVRRAYLDCVRCPLVALGRPESELAGLVTSQENACRYCYGSARVRMKMIGFSDEMIDRIERNVQLAEAEPRERELVLFCRNLARSKPRPSRAARVQMMNVGFSALETAELAFVVAAVGFCNRVSTLLAMPPELGMESVFGKEKGIWHKLSAWLPGKKPTMSLPPPNYPPASFQGPYGGLVQTLADSPAAPPLEVMLNGAFASKVLPQRTLMLMFAVVAHTLECGLCESTAADLLDAGGFSRAELAEVLQTLGSPRLSEMEALLIPWARDTVWMPEQPARIQARTRPLLDALGPEVLVEAVGAAALANSCVRLAMLQT
jgi:alkylhydroperoxidase family enzyme